MNAENVLFDVDITSENSDGAGSLSADVRTDKTKALIDSSGVPADKAVSLRECRSKWRYYQLGHEILNV